MTATTNERATATSAVLQGRQRWLIIALSAAIFMINLDSRVIAPLLPTIANAFHTSVSSAGILITAYMLPYGFFQLFYGPLSDRIGKVKVVAFAMVLFSVGTALCGASTSLARRDAPALLHRHRGGGDLPAHARLYRRHGAVRPAAGDHRHPDVLLGGGDGVQHERRRADRGDRLVAARLPDLRRRLRHRRGRAALPAQGGNSPAVAGPAPAPARHLSRRRPRAPDAAAPPPDLRRRVHLQRRLLLSRRLPQSPLRARLARDRVAARLRGRHATEHGARAALSRPPARGAAADPDRRGA